jgi:hypothetical protein
MKNEIIEIMKPTIPIIAIPIAVVKAICLYSGGLGLCVIAITRWLCSKNKRKPLPIPRTSELKFIFLQNLTR